MPNAQFYHQTQLLVSRGKSERALRLSANIFVYIAALRIRYFIDNDDNVTESE